MAQEVPDWIVETLNGGSVRVPHDWQTRDLRPDDLVAGKIVERTEHGLTVSVEAGTLGGQQLQPGEWRRVNLHRVSVLTAWDERDNPQVGDRVAIRFLGHSDTGRVEYAAGVARAEPKPPAWE